MLEQVQPEVVNRSAIKEPEVVRIKLSLLTLLNPLTSLSLRKNISPSLNSPRRPTSDSAPKVAIRSRRVLL